MNEKVVFGIGYSITIKLLANQNEYNPISLLAKSIIITKLHAAFQAANNGYLISLMLIINSCPMCRIHLKKIKISQLITLYGIVMT